MAGNYGDLQCLIFCTHTYRHIDTDEQKKVKYICMRACQNGGQLWNRNALAAFHKDSEKYLQHS